MRRIALALCLAMGLALAPLAVAAQTASGTFQWTAADGTRFECDWRMWTEHSGTMRCRELWGTYWFDCDLWVWSWHTSMSCRDQYGNTWST